jgi:hypothetical protein
MTFRVGGLRWFDDGDVNILHASWEPLSRLGPTRIVAAGFAIVARGQFGRCQTGGQFGPDPGGGHLTVTQDGLDLQNRFLGPSRRLYRLPYPLRRRRHFDMAHAKLGQRIDHRIDRHRERRHGAAFAGRADAERMGR